MSGCECKPDRAQPSSYKDQFPYTEHLYGMSIRAKKLTISKLREEAAGCRACDLWKIGTQTVFGEGGSKARVMLVGEQPGDQEDLEGRPFVGPAGKLLDKALEAAG